MQFDTLLPCLLNVLEIQSNNLDKWQLGVFCLILFNPNAFIDFI